MTEREHIEAAQVALEAVKSNLKDIMRINREAGRAAAANATFMTLAELNVCHGRATERLLANWPGYGDVVAQGPGGR